MTILLYVLVAAGYLGLCGWAWKTAMAHSGSRLGAGSSARLNAPSGRASATSMPIAEFAGGFPGDGTEAPLAVLSPRGRRAGDSMTGGERVLLFAVWAAHAWLIREAVFAGGGLTFGFAIALSATMWLAVAVVWVESLSYGLASMRLLVLPLAAMCALLPLWFPGIPGLAAGGTASGAQAALRDWKFELHLLVALAAYGILTIAALQALLMAALERWLHSHAGRDEKSGKAGGAKFDANVDVWTADLADPSLWTRTHDALLGRLPPLLTLERLLFRLVGAGFVLLTLTVATGAAFSEDVFGQPMKFDHKTVFTIVSWLIFGALLAGRHFRGWRGRVALRWTLSGFVAMLLAYVGSRFVLEVILHRF